jgi:hypothetical protein
MVVRLVDHGFELFLCAILRAPAPLLVELAEVVDIIDVVSDAILVKNLVFRATGRNWEVYFAGSLRRRWSVMKSS